MLAFPHIGRAQVSLPTVNLGDTNFEDGYAGSGFFGEEFPDYYTASEMKDANGNTLPGRNRVTAVSTTTHLVFLSKKRLWGGLYGGEVLLPLVDLDVNLANGPSERVRGLGDLTVSPLILEWPSKTLSHGIIAQRFVFDIVLPTGKYSAQRPANIGSHSVALNPYYAVTYAPNSKLEASLRFHYLWNSENNEPFEGLGFKDIQAGQAFHANYATSYAVRKDFRLGFNGYWLQQITDHRINEKDVRSSRERTIGLGPGIQLGGQGLWLRANSYIETGVRNRMSGIKVTLRVSKTF
ncbi:MAG TPA: transporter [Acidisarcina sp.]|nr:transporter [Acidisarcina sp.]